MYNKINGINRFILKLTKNYCFSVILINLMASDIWILKF